MTDLLISNAFPCLILLLLFAAFWRASNMTVTLSFAAKTHAPEPGKDDVREYKKTIKHLTEQIAEQREARRIAEELRGGVR